MSAYVDQAVHRYRGMLMCHLLADTPAELHAMADRIGVRRCWFQCPPAASFWHYDVCKTKRRLAVAAGAIECDRRALAEAMQRIRASRAFEIHQDGHA